MNGEEAMALDWPVEHGGTAVVSAGDEVLSWREGTDEATRFPVASVTKLLSSLAALAAVEAGHLELDDEVPGGPPDRPEPGATVRHLLAHTSGLPHEPGGRTRRPGERRVYSNMGFRVLADLVTETVGEPFADWLAASVLRPLGMTSTDLAAWKGVDADPAAGAVSTLPDLALLAGCLLDQGAPVVGGELFAEAVKVQFPGLAGLVPGVGRFDPCDWGLGFELKDGKEPHWMGAARSPASFGHFGASGCFVWVDPRQGVAAAAVSDRPFEADSWGMRTWPAWSDRVKLP
jgi:CubicO group peptidase (beta-lactamase class C family)